ncbi:MAG TPA: GAF domain-containing sensor histidine kinase [Chloroflexota bacterium]|jgi:signal transduction histidine kinase
MKSPALPADEPARLAALQALNILDTPPEERFDRITRVARHLFSVPIALISLVDANRQWFKSAQGLTERETSREVSFCGHAILGGGPFVVADARDDPRFADNPQVTGPPQVRFYAGYPLGDAAGHRLGTLCLMDCAPREFGAEERGLLRDVAAWAEAELNGATLSQALLSQQESEARVRQAEADLAAALAAQQTANAELERLNRTKSEFVSIVSHEFRTALTGIQGFSEMMRDEDFTLEEMKEYAGDINKDAQRLNRMITEMLDLDRMESGRMTLNVGEVDLNQVIAEVAERARPNAPDHSIRLALDESLPPLSGDRDKLTQVLTNLVSNAVKYSPEGGEIALTSRREDGTAHVLVQDHGMGIPPEALEKVFERFSRVESDTSHYIQGTGLGLPIVRQIVQMHGGRAWVESTLGEGSTFQFTVPLVGPPTTA